MEAREIRRIARENLRGNWKVSVLVAFVAALLNGLLCASGFDIEISEELQAYLPQGLLTMLAVYATISSILNLVGFIVGGTVQLGYANFLLQQHDRQDADLYDLFGQFHRFGDGFVQYILRSLYSILWMLLFIIPGIIKTYAYSMTPFLMAEHPEMTPSDAIAASQELMDGHKTELFFLDLSFFGWHLLNVLTLGIGSLWLNPYMNAARAAFYRQITAQRDAETQDSAFVTE